MSTWERLADLPVQIDNYALEPLKALVSSEFERASTVVHLHGGGAEGLGEDVTYDAVDHEIAQSAFQAGGRLALTGRFTLASFAQRVAELDLFPQPPQREVSQRYRVWAYESAALDLALRQAGTTLHEALGREPQPVRFVVSLRLGEPPCFAGNAHHQKHDGLAHRRAVNAAPAREQRFRLERRAAQNVVDAGRQALHPFQPRRALIEFVFQLDAERDQHVDIGEVGRQFAGLMRE